nr:MAG: hypothetical protein TU35_09205 [Thermoproteus sp. AZ2]
MPKLLSEEVEPEAPLYQYTMTMLLTFLSVTNINIIVLLSSIKGVNQAIDIYLCLFTLIL